MRRTNIAYENNTECIYNRLIHLPKTITTTVNNVVVSKTVYEYDNGNVATYLTGRSDIDTATHDPAYNPASGSYVSTTEARGNVTKITSFSDATLTTDSNASVTTIKYDIAGNPVEEGVSCCRLKIISYGQNFAETGYAYPVSETRGDAGQLMTSVTYDRNTGLVKTGTDENLQTSTVTYNPDNLRVIRTDSPNGAWATAEYNDATYPYYVKSTTSLDATRSVSSWSFANGRGQGFRNRGLTANGYLSSEVEFDIIGRPVRSYSPYTVAGLSDNRPTGIKFSEVTQRDGLGRTLVSNIARSYNCIGLIQRSYSNRD